MIHYNTLVSHADSRQRSTKSMRMERRNRCLRLAFSTLIVAVVIVTGSSFYFSSPVLRPLASLPQRFRANFVEPTIEKETQTFSTLSSSSEATLATRMSTTIRPSSPVPLHSDVSSLRLSAIDGGQTSPPPQPSPETTAATEKITIMDTEPYEGLITEEDFETTFFTGDPEVDYPPFPSLRNGSVGYSVFTETCRIPKYDSGIEIEIEDQRTTQSDTAASSYLHQAPRFIIHRAEKNGIKCFDFDEDALRESYPNIPLERWNCSHKEISDSAGSGSPGAVPDSSFGPQDCIEGHMLLVTCSVAPAGLVYQQILIEPSIVDESDSIAPPKENKNALNVIVIEVETLSRADLHKRLQKSMEFLKAAGDLVEMVGYNIIGKNPEGNRRLLLTGSVFEETFGIPSKANPGDHGDFVWTNFKREGFETVVHIERELIDNSSSTVQSISPIDHLPVAFFGSADVSSAMSWNLVKHSSTDPSETSQESTRKRTDPKLRSLLIENLFFQKTGPSEFPPLWRLGENTGFPKSEGLRPFKEQNMGRKYYFRYIIDMLKELDRKRPLFSYRWFAYTDSDESENVGITFDSHLVEFLGELSESALLNDTAIVLVSDSASKTRGRPVPTLSSVEDLLLAGIMWFPPRFAEEYREKMDLLRMNSKSFITARDLHATLLHLTDLTATQGSRTTKVAYSLLNRILPDRSCSEAGVPIDFCACLGRMAIDVDGRLARSFSEAVIQRAKSANPQSGAQLELEGINGLVRFSKGSHWTDIFKTSIRVRPSADIEAIARFSWRTNSWEFLSDLRIVNATDNRNYHPKYYQTIKSSPI